MRVLLWPRFLSASTVSMFQVSNPHSLQRSPQPSPPPPLSTYPAAAAAPLQTAKRGELLKQVRENNAALAGFSERMKRSEAKGGDEDVLGKLLRSGKHVGRKADNENVHTAKVEALPRAISWDAHMDNNPYTKAKARKKKKKKQKKKDDVEQQKVEDAAVAASSSSWWKVW